MSNPNQAPEGWLQMTLVHGRYLHLKTRPKKDEEQRFALLLRPQEQSGLTCDKELYQRIREHGRAVIWIYKPDNPFQLEEKPVMLSPEEFERQWIGD